MPGSRSAVLLGAGSPWGRVLAEALAREDHPLLLVDAPGPELDRTREMAENFGGTVQALAPDFRTLPPLFEAARHVPSPFATPELLVHALPPPETGLFAERAPGLIETEVHRGYSSLVVFAHELVPRMVEAGGGRLIALGSAAARAPLSKATVHSAVALAVPTFLRSLAPEVFHERVRVTYLEPAGFPSPPVPAEVAEGTRPIHGHHRRFLVTDAAVARAFVRVLRHPSIRHLRFHTHDRAPPAAPALQRYAERELHARHPEVKSPRWALRRHRPASLRGKTAVVTGGSRGIGRAIAHRLAHLGMHVVLTARDAALLEEVAKEVREKGGEASTFPQELTDPGAPEKIRAFVAESGGPPWLLVNNAGIGCFRRLERQDEETISSQIRIDLVALLAMTRTFLPDMLAQGQGEVLNVGSAAAEVPLPRLAPYSGIKGAVKGFTIALDREVGHRGLSASVLEPVTVDTDFVVKASDPGRVDIRLRPWARYAIIGAPEVGLLAERTVVEPRPVVLVPPRARPLVWAAQHLRPLLEPGMRLEPPPRRPAAPSAQ